ncbi:MAG: O-methyltransferase [Burkholderiales bacterium]|nr:O-methyltransferase [Burkholderiales bacterium]
MLKTPITPELIAYCESLGTRESDILASLRNETLKLSNSQMLITPIQGAFLKLLAQITNASKILEIGMFTGYSALWLASGLNEFGSLITLDISDKHLELANKHWVAANLQDKIKPIIAPAEETLKAFIDDNFKFDIIFIDANKSQYIEYYESSLKILNDGGIIILDNVLMYGQVLAESPQKNFVKTLKQLNELIKNDNRVDMVMLPIGDGLTIARKRDTQ